MSTSDGKDTTPLKMGSNRISLLTGSIKRTTPYKVLGSIDRRQRLFPNLTQDDSMLNRSVGLSSAMNSLYDVKDDSLSTPSEGNKSIRKACLDWRLVNKEAEVIRLKTELTQLQSLMNSIKEGGEKHKIEYQKELKEAENQLTQSRQIQREKERRVIELEAEVESLRQEKQQQKESLLPEREHHENLITQLKLNDSKLRGELQDLKQDLQRTQFNHDQEKALLEHEKKCREIEIESLKEAKKVYERNHESLRKEAQEARQLRLELNQLIMEKDSLRNQLQDFKDGQALSQLLIQDKEQASQNK